MTNLIKWASKNRRLGKQRCNQILEILNDGNWRTTKEIAEQLPCCYQQTISHLNRLISEGKILCSRKAKTSRYGQPSKIWKINNDFQYPGLCRNLDSN
ncbi:hypothetical protein [Laspinema olomoucense]|uniref:HTH arsR-type domain-containing protein n=1 Tax=Laspinema olomoucense D3b TaxID=2953688 RepID=A0ABT2N4H0_9CYAN|nr:hypothetical protein [Laspinema sp. D3b]MCT7977553.1 hypothetical protein [Laspinema sp. D3b]